MGGGGGVVVSFDVHAHPVGVGGTRGLGGRGGVVSFDVHANQLARVGGLMLMGVGGKRWWDAGVVSVGGTVGSFDVHASQVTQYGGVASLGRKGGGRSRAGGLTGLDSCETFRVGLLVTIWGLAALFVNKESGLRKCCSIACVSNIQSNKYQ